MAGKPTAGIVPIDAYPATGSELLVADVGPLRTVDGRRRFVHPGEQWGPGPMTGGR